MLFVYGIAPSEIVLTGSVVVEFPPLSGRPVGGVIPVDCKVSVLTLATSALGDSTLWPWKPADRGYVITCRNAPFSLLKNHLRQIRHLQDASGCNQIWPWFDPRYLKLALKALKGHQLEKLFGPIESFAFATASGLELMQLRAGALHVSQVSS
ncbi:MAG: hypothetical protein LW710_01960 [Burkholderiales bacterium]|jgi:hypothetical protein|uniref:hypothetical protein n=1 Tax=Limnobacter sp. TaxID=2003368 RepID=UPI003927EF71|nr:hypothetical protein [Burkholderiales bacterium]